MVCSSVSRKLLSPFGSLLGLVWCPGGGREGGGREGEPQGRGVRERKERGRVATLICMSEIN